MTHPRCAQLCAARALLALPFVLQPALAQDTACEPQWLPTFGTHPGADGVVRAMHVADVGAGSALYVGGEFLSIAGTNAAAVARWDGSAWEPLAETGFGVHALASFDDGTGLELHAGGFGGFPGTQPAGGLNGIAAWDGDSWEPLGLGLSSTGFQATIVSAMAVFDEGSGPALFVAGRFEIAGTTTVNHIARWDGVAWSALVTGTNGWVRSLVVHDDGDGPALYAGGDFTAAGGVDVAHVARWDGAAWTAVGGGTNGAVNALAAFDFGAGAELVAGGAFTVAGGIGAQRLARWDGSQWAPLGQGSLANVGSLAVHGGVGGPALHASGSFTGATTAVQVGRWDGATWVVVDQEFAAAGPTIHAMASHQGSLWAGGSFSIRDGALFEHLTFDDGTGWQPLGSGANDAVLALAVHDDGSGTALWAAGAFESIDGTSGSIVKRVGRGWRGFEVESDLSVGLVHALEPFDDGNGMSLWAAGQFDTIDGVPNTTTVARWDGSAWHPTRYFGDGPNHARTLLAFDDGTGAALYMGGEIGIFGFGTARNIVRRTVHGPWTIVGDGLPVMVRDLAAFDDGAGSKLYAAGAFAGGIARWDGVAWTQVGPGVDANVFSLGVHAHGARPELYVGASGGVRVWDGTGFPTVGQGSPAFVQTLHSGSFAGQPALFAGGTFETAGGVEVNNVARWDGTHWLPLGSGVGPGSKGVYELATYDDGNGAALLVAGAFPLAFESGDAFLAKWGCGPAVATSAARGSGHDTLALTSRGHFPTLRAEFEVASASERGWTVLYAGLGGRRAADCDLALADVGGLLLSAVAEPIEVARGPLVGGIATLRLGPAAPELAGVEFAFQAITFPAGGDALPTLSHALRTVLVP